MNTPKALTICDLELTDELRWILGRPCFTLASIAQILRNEGLYKCERKAEDEQAVAIHWMLMMYLEHGDKWREIGESELKSIHERHKEERNVKS